MKYLLIGVGLLLLSSTANAQECYETQRLEQLLRDNYQESRQAIGLVNDNQGLIQVFVNPDTGTWTLVATGPNGVSCIAVAGDNWKAIEERLPPNG
jgi:hypothetical protein